MSMVFQFKPKSKSTESPSTASATRQTSSRVIQMWCTLDLRGRPTASHFDAITEVKLNGHRYDTANEKSPGWLTLNHVPRFMLYSVKQVTGGKHKEEVVLCACLTYGLDRMQASESFEELSHLRKVVLDGDLEDEELAAAYQVLENLIHLTKTDCGTGFRRRNIRCPEKLLQRLAGVSDIIGASKSDLAIALIMDGLRGTATNWTTFMTDRVQELYRKLWAAIDKLKLEVESAGRVRKEKEEERKEIEERDRRRRERKLEEMAL